MKIVHLIAGAGSMYCGSCMHGNSLATALRRAGADVLLAPVYTPLRTDEENISISHLSLGGINVFLDASWKWWRRAPGFVRRLLDRPGFVAWTAGFSGGTRPEQLGHLTLAMLRGDDGPLKDDVDQLLDWLQTDTRPDVVHLSNIMLAALARPIKERLGVPVVASLTGEDGFLERLPQPYYDQVIAELRARAADCDAIVALGRDYADFMAEYLRVPRGKIEVVRPGLNLEAFAGAGSTERGARSTERTIGFLSRICPDKGLHLLLDAIHAMKEMPGAPPCRLRVAGYLDRADHRYLHIVRKQAAAWGMADRFEYVGELDRAGKIAFLDSLDVLCVPSLLRESKGLPVLEAWACGVPVVLPDYGVFSELVADTGGGLLYDPQRPEALPSTLVRMLADPHFAADCGSKAHRTVREKYTAEREAREMMAVYRKLLGGSSSG